MTERKAYSMTTVADANYLIIVYGVVADAMPPVAFRRSGKTAQAGRKRIKCPQCGDYFVDVPKDTTVRIFRAPKEEQRKAVPGMQPRRCLNCNTEVGVVMI